MPKRSVSCIFAFLVFIGLGSTLASAQTVRLSGHIKSEISLPISYANVVARMASDTTHRIFSITDQSGRYRLKLDKDSLYYLQISYLGYKSVRDTLRLSQDTERNYRLQRISQRLPLILIHQKLPVVVLDDKTIYDADAFRNGNERVLYGLLKKMPGLQVDRDGNVKINGKPVVSLTIEGHRFFTGDPRLGVMNIPADAVAKVVVNKNHHQIGMLNGVSDNGSVSLNIVLKKGHKKFMFGESKLGGGIEDRYLVNPNIFYYSPNSSVNFIGNLNNTGSKDFSSSSFQNFSSDFSRLTLQIGNFGSRQNQTIGNFLSSGQHVFSKVLFGAANLNQKLAKYWRMNANAFVKKGKTRTHRTLFNQYLTDGKTSEFRDFTTDHRLFYTMDKLRFSYDNLDDAEMLIDLIYKHADGSGTDLTQSETNVGHHYFRTGLSP